MCALMKELGRVGRSGNALEISKFLTQSPKWSYFVITQISEKWNIHFTISSLQLEPRMITMTKEVPLQCSPDKNRELFDQTSILINGTIYELPQNKSFLINSTETLGIENLCQNMTNVTDSFQNLYEIAIEMNVTRSIVTNTNLKKNPVYYNIYCIAINTFFASLLPFIALTYFNISIAKKLKARQVSFYMIFIYPYICNKRRVANKRRVLKKYQNLINVGPGIFVRLNKEIAENSHFFRFSPKFSMIFFKNK